MKPISTLMKPLRCRSVHDDRCAAAIERAMCAVPRRRSSAKLWLRLVPPMPSSRSSAYTVADPDAAYKRYAETLAARLRPRGAR